SCARDFQTEDLDDVRADYASVARVRRRVAARGVRARDPALPDRGLPQRIPNAPARNSVQNLAAVARGVHARRARHLSLVHDDRAALADLDASVSRELYLRSNADAD